MDSISSTQQSKSTSVLTDLRAKESPEISKQPASANTFAPETENMAPALTVEEVDYAVEVINDTMTLINRSLSFRVDDQNGRTVISIIDRDTDETIKQIPSEDLLKLINHMQELQSLLSGEEV